MFCNYCGKEIVDGSLFCNYCGKKLPNNSCLNEKSEQREKKTKVFNFSGMTYNKENTKEINEWLHSNAIQIISVGLHTFMNKNVPIKWETVIARFEITYYEIETKRRYSLGHFKSKKWIGTEFDLVEAAFEEWKQTNSTLNVVWHRYAGHQASDGTTQSVYFLYM